MMRVIRKASETRRLRIPPPSEPGADAEGEAEVSRALARLPREDRRLPEFSLIDDADIGREFPAELVTQPEARIDVGKPGSDQAGRIRFAVEVELELRLKNQPLSDQNVVRGLELGGEMTLAADKSGDLEIEEVGGKALNAERRPIARGS